MNYYEDEQNVTQYSKFTPAHDGALLVDVLSAHLPEGSCLLELGMGPGKDLQLLSQHFQVTGSDFSRLFLEKYRAQHASADLLHLDARTLDTERTFDAIFSNKALIHLSADELQQSFDRQHAVLNDRGLIMHSFWYGEGQKEFGGLTLVYHNEHDLTGMLEPAFEILALERHAKMAEGDSIYVVARKK
jgi:cyclopropane fatty-acyl-phospholipid synthase-like methyltransferase